jgi:uncharacterized protein (TIGR01777 family)
MRFLVTGATGFLGRHLAGALAGAGHEVVALSRDVRRAASVLPGVRLCEWNGVVGLPPAEAFDGVDVVMNLIGERIDRRWTDERRRRLRDSRVLPTRSLVERIAGLDRRPRALVSMGGVSYYGSRGTEVLTERSEAGTGFLADLAREWEAAATQAEASGVRVVVIRCAAVLAREGGFLQRMLPVFRLGVGGRLGSGRQYFPWIHLADLLGLLLLSATRDDLRGPVNAVAPEPVTNAELTAALAEALHRPAAVTVPGFALKLAFGAMAEELMLASTRVSPIRALEAGYTFRFPLLRQALADVLARRPEGAGAPSAPQPPPSSATAGG